MDIQYHGQSLRKRKTKELALKIVTDYTAGQSAAEIAKKYQISRNWVYILMRKLKRGEI